MNITFVSTHLGHVRGGAEVNDLNLGAELAELGHDVTYVTGVDPKREPKPLERPHKLIDFKYLFGLSYKFPDIIGKILRHLNERYFVRQVRQQARDRLEATDLLLSTGRPILTDLRSVTGGLQFHAVRGRSNPRYDKYLVQADALVFWGGCREEYEKNQVLDRPYLELDPAVDRDLFQPGPPSPNVLETVSSEDVVLSFVGRLEPVKRVDRIIQAVDALADEHEVRLFVIGDGSRRAALEREVKERRLEETVTFTGELNRKKIPEFLNASDIFVLASKMENHPIALKEAASCGTFCVAPSIGRIGDILYSRIGETYEPNDVETLTRTLQEVINMEDYNKGTREDRAAQYNDWSDNAQSIIDLYQRLNSKRSSADLISRGDEHPP